MSRLRPRMAFYAVLAFFVLNNFRLIPIQKAKCPIGREDSTAIATEEETNNASNEARTTTRVGDKQSGEENSNDSTTNAAEGTEWWRGKKWWRGRANIRNASHPHLGARLWGGDDNDGEQPILQMIVDPSPKRLMSPYAYDNYNDGYTKKGRDPNRNPERNFTHIADNLLCPRGDPNGTLYPVGIEGKGGNAVLLKIRGGIEKSRKHGGRKRKSRILCMIYTVDLPGSRSDLQAQAETWGSQCDGFIAASNATDHSIGSIDLVHQGPEEYRNMWQKIRSMWAYAYDHFLDEYDFFHIAGDDVYMVIENLRSFLDGPDVIRLEDGYLDEISIKMKASKWDKEKGPRPLIIGLPFSPKKTLSPGLNTVPRGGPGYTLNRAALEFFGKAGKMDSFLKDNIDSREDVFVGSFFQGNGIYLSHTLDRTGGLRYQESAEWLSRMRNHAKFASVGLTRGEYLDYAHVSEEFASFHLKKDKKWLKKNNRTMAELMHRYHAILYDLCSPW